MGNMTLTAFFFLTILIQHCQPFGVVELQLDKFISKTSRSNLDFRCCEKSCDKDCRPTFKFTVDGRVVGVTNALVEGRDKDYRFVFTFPQGKISQNFTNPLLVAFDTTLKVTIKIKIEIFRANGQAYDTLTADIPLTASAFQEKNDFQVFKAETPKRAFFPKHLLFTARSYCKSNYKAPDCLEKLCVARDDEKGHYDCDAEGRKICLKGWMEPESNCTEPSQEEPIKTTLVPPTSKTSISQRYTSSALVKTSQTSEIQPTPTLTITNSLSSTPRLSTLFHSTINPGANVKVVSTTTKNVASTSVVVLTPKERRPNKGPELASTVEYYVAVPLLSMCLLALLVFVLFGRGRQLCRRSRRRSTHECEEASDDSLKPEPGQELDKIGERVACLSPPVNVSSVPSSRIDVKPAKDYSTFPSKPDNVTVSLFADGHQLVNKQPAKHLARSSDYLQHDLRMYSYNQAERLKKTSSRPVHIWASKISPYDRSLQTISMSNLGRNEKHSYMISETA